MFFPRVFKIFIMAFAVALVACSPKNNTTTENLPKAIDKIMQQPRYAHSNWGIFVKDLNTGKVLFNHNSSKLFLPASTTKLFSVSALLNTFGLDYRFRTPIYAVGDISDGVLTGNLILVGKGDLTLGGRRTANDKIAFTNFDHVDANAIPGTVLTKQNPLAGLIKLAQQIKKSGITTIKGHVIIDTRYFATTPKREDVLSAITVNDNLLDFTATPSTIGEAAHLNWRPQIPQLQVVNEVKTVAAGEGAELEIVSNADESKITIRGSIGVDQKNIINVYPIKNPAQFSHDAFVMVLKKEGINVVEEPAVEKQLPSVAEYKQLKPLAVLVSAPLIEYAKLILKVSHNVGANLVPLLLAAHHHETSYMQGMPLIGDFIKNVANINSTEFSFSDAAGGANNRLTPTAAVQLLTYWHQQPKNVFNQFVYALPILGVDGSLAHVATETPAKAHIFAKTGTGVAYNAVNRSLFLTTKALAGYIHAKNDHWLAFMVVVNNAPMKDIQTVFAINNDVGLVAASLYDAVGKSR